MRRAVRIKRAVWSLAAILLCLSFPACDELDEESGDGAAAFTDDDDGDTYPYFLAVGGGLSETFSILKIKRGREYEFFKDIALTGSSINQVVVHDDELVAVCSLSNSLVVYDSQLQLRREVSVGQGANPMSVAFTPDGTAWVASLLADDVRQLDLRAGLSASERLLNIVPMPAGDILPHDTGVQISYARPNGLAIADDELFVGLANLDAAWNPAGPAVIAVLSATSGEILATVVLAGRKVVGLQYDAARGLVWACSAGEMNAPDEFLGNGRLEAVDPETRQVVVDIPIAGSPMEMVIGSDGLAYLGNGMDGRLLLADLDAGAQLASVDLRLHPASTGLSFISALAMDPDGFLYVAEFNSDYLYVLDPAHDHDVVYELVVNDGPDTLTILP